MTEGSDVFTPVVEIEGIDAVVRTSEGTYCEVQVKTRSKDGPPVFQTKPFKPRDNFYIVVHFADSEDFWVLPSKVFIPHSHKVRAHGRDFTRLTLSRAKRQELNEFHNAFYLLKRA